MFRHRNQYTQTGSSNMLGAYPMLLVLLLLLSLFAGDPQNTFALPAASSHDGHGPMSAFYRRSAPMYTDFMMPEASDEYIDQAPPRPSKQRFKVVRNSNGTLGVVILDDAFGRPHIIEQIEPDRRPQPSEIAFNQHSNEAEPSDEEYVPMDVMLMGAGAGKATRQQAVGSGFRHDLGMDDKEDHFRAPRASVPDIVFPTDPPTVHKPYKAPSHCGNNQTFCEDVADYPLAAIEAIIDREAHRYVGLFDTETPSDLATRFGDSDDDMGEQAMCDSDIRTIWPKTGLTEDNTWAYIVNSEKYLQGVRVEECKSADKPCNFSKNFASNVRTQCRQLSMYRKLLAMKDIDSVPEYTLFQFHSCCQCRVSTQPTG